MNPLASPDSRAEHAPGRTSLSRNRSPSGTTNCRVGALRVRSGAPVLLRRGSAPVLSRGTPLALRPPMPSRPRTRPLHVTVVSNNAETLQRLLAYFDESGVPTAGTRALRDLSTIAPTTTAVVLFPDDYPERDVSATVTALRRARPRVLLLVVTREPQRFASTLTPDERSTAPLVLPKPSFGWSILDAIRAHAQPTTS